MVDYGTNREGCGANGGGAPPPGRTERDCGKRWGWLEPSLKTTGRGRVELGGDTGTWADNPLAAFDPTDPGGGDSLGSTYADCPFWLGGPPTTETGETLLPAPERLPTRTLFDKRRKRIVVDFGRTKDHRQGAFAGRTIVASKLTLTRVKRWTPPGAR